MHVTISTETINPMTEAINKLKKGTLSREELSKVLDMRDYQIEFKRYGIEGMPVCKIEKEEFMNYFLQILTIKEDEIQNERLRMKHKELLEFISHLEENLARIQPMMEINEDDVHRVEENLNHAIPEKYLNMISIDEIKVLFTISIGNSMGWPYENYVHFDVIQMEKMLGTKEQMTAILSHEIHHQIYGKILDLVIQQGITPEEYFVLFPSFEGLAVKFCNNASGTLTNPLYHDRASNISLDPDTWNFFTEEYPYMYQKFLDDLSTIRKENWTLEQVDQFIGKEWLCPVVQSLIDGKTRNVVVYRNYFLGLQIYGRLYDLYGLDGLFERIAHLKDHMEEVLAAGRL